MKQQQGHVRETGKMGKQLWPIESRPFGGSIGHFFLDEAERPQDVLAAQGIGRVEKAAERLLERRLRPVIVHGDITFTLRAGLYTIKLTVKLVVLYLGIDML